MPALVPAGRHSLLRPEPRPRSNLEFSAGMVVAMEKRDHDAPHRRATIGDPEDDTLRLGDDPHGVVTDGDGAKVNQR